MKYVGHHNKGTKERGNKGKKEQRKEERKERQKKACNAEHTIFE